MATVRELITRLGFNVDTSGLGKYEKGTERVKQNANDAAASFRNMFAAFAGFAAVRSIAGIADSMQSLEARIGMLPQTIGDVGKTMGEVGKHAIATRTPLDAYGALYLKIGNAAKDYIGTQEELFKVTDTLANALVVGGATAAEAGSAMLQFAQALGSGVLQGDEFRAMAEAAPQYLDQLAVAMGIPREQLKKMASDGKLTTKAVIEATKTMSEYFERRAKQMPMTIGQAFTDVETKFKLMIAEINRESGIVTKVAETIISAMDKVMAGVGKFVEFVGGAENALKLLMITFGALLAVMLPGWIAAASATLIALAPIIEIIAALVFVGLLFEDFYGWMNGSDSLLGDFIGGVEKWRTELDNVKVAFDAIAAVAGFLWEHVIKQFLGVSFIALTLGLKAIGLLFEGILWTVSKLVEGAKYVSGIFGGGGVTPTGSKTSEAMARANAATQSMMQQSQTINVTVPPGSPAATQEAARRGVDSALNANPDYFSQQMGQAL